MALSDRDYMQRSTSQASSARWWRRWTLLQWVGVATAVLALGSTAIWFVRDARGLGGLTRPSEGSLRVNLNTASARQLESLPGIGPALANLIIAGRPYKTIDELEKVRGVGPRTMQSLRPLLTVDEPTAGVDR